MRQALECRTEDQRVILVMPELTVTSTAGVGWGEGILESHLSSWLRRFWQAVHDAGALGIGGWRRW